MADSASDGGKNVDPIEAGTGGVDAVDDDTLSVRIQDPTEMTIRVLTIACAGDCADVRAVARGGNPPYAYVWDDGSTDAKRHVCLDAGTELTVDATDTAIVGEFAREARTAHASVTANVLQCNQDAGVPAGICVDNPSFEGTPIMNLPVFDAPPWGGCGDRNVDFPGSLSTPDILDANTLGFGTGLPAPTDGTTYFGLGMYTLLSASLQHEYVSGALCAPLEAGHSYAFEIDLASLPLPISAAPARGPAQLAVYGSATDCAREELLWKSPVVGTDWTTVCATLTPSKDASFLTLEPTGTEPTEGAYLLVDNLIPVESCP